MEATVAERGQITLPKAVRDALGLTKGTRAEGRTRRRAHRAAQGRVGRVVASCAVASSCRPASPPTTSCASCVAAPRATRTRHPTTNDDRGRYLGAGRLHRRRRGAPKRPRTLARGAERRPGGGLRGRDQRGCRRAGPQRHRDGDAGGDRHKLLCHSSCRAAVRAGEMQRRYKERLRRAAEPSPTRRSVPDFLIGAHALLQCGGLITRDAGFFRDYFKGLKVIVPQA